jgi:hypothetical protein
MKNIKPNHGHRFTAAQHPRADDGKFKPNPDVIRVPKLIYTKHQAPRPTSARRGK